MTKHVLRFTRSDTNQQQFHNFYILCSSNLDLIRPQDKSSPFFLSGLSQIFRVLLEVLSQFKNKTGREWPQVFAELPPVALEVSTFSRELIIVLRCEVGEF